MPRDYYIKIMALLPILWEGLSQLSGLRRQSVPSMPLEGDKWEQLGDKIFLSNMVMFTTFSCHVCGVFFNGKSTVSDLFLWTITLFDHSYSLYLNMGKCKGKFKTVFEIYTRI